MLSRQRDRRLDEQKHQRAAAEPQSADGTGFPHDAPNGVYLYQLVANLERKTIWQKGHNGITSSFAMPRRPAMLHGPGLLYSWLFLGRAAQFRLIISTNLLNILLYYDFVIFVLPPM